VFEIKSVQRFDNRFAKTIIVAHQRSFEWYHPRPPTASSSPRLGVRSPNLQSLLSQERV